MRALIVSVLATTALTLSACSMGAGETASVSSNTAAKAVPDFAEAVSAPGRDAKDIELDGSRQPAKVLALMGLKRGDKVADILAGGGYYSEIMGRAVGAGGSVTAFNTGSFAKTERSVKKWSEVKARQTNVADRFVSFPEFSAEAGHYDFAMMHLVFHDLYWESEKFNFPRVDPAKFLSSLHAAMKPGGIVAVVDHVGGEGETRAVVEKTHRINPAIVKKNMTAAGFELVGESDMFANPEDDVNKLVFDPSIRGKTNRFVMKFRKPS